MLITSNEYKCKIRVLLVTIMKLINIIKLDTNSLYIVFILS